MIEKVFDKLFQGEQEETDHEMVFIDGTKMESSGQLCFGKPANYDARKTKKFRSQIGRIENMRCDPQEDAFKKLWMKRKNIRLKTHLSEIRVA